MRNFRIDDESGDKKYFTMVPNFVLNHSSAVDQAVYLQMKRYAGENGTCFASGKTIQKKLSIGKVSYNRSVKYLLEHNWIYLKGKTLVETRGGPQMVKVYGLRDLWKLNNDFYNKGGPKETTLRKGGPENQKGGLKSIKGGSRTAPKKNIRKTQEEGVSIETGEEQTEQQSERMRELVEIAHGRIKRIPTE